MHEILYIGWIECNSLDYDLMFECFNKLFDKYLDSTKYSLTYSKANFDFNSIDEYDCIVLGGGSRLLEPYIDILYKAMLKKKKVVVWGSGYDGSTKEFLDTLENTNEPSYLYSYSAEEKLQELVNYSDFFCVRGPLTYKILSKSFVDTSNVLISGDPRFLLSGEDINKNSPIFKFCDSDKIIAINWGTCLNNIYGENEKYIEDILANVCNTLIDRGYKIYLYIVSKEDIKPCQDLYEKINNKNNVILDTTLYTGNQTLSILKKCHISINLKLHASIMSAVARVPFVCLGYRFKAVDFVKSISCEDLLIFTDGISSSKDIIDKIKYINTNYNSIIDIINNQIESYNFILEMPFKNNLF